MMDNLDGNKSSVYIILYIYDYNKMDSVVQYKLTYSLSNFSVTIDIKSKSIYTKHANLPVV